MGALPLSDIPAAFMKGQIMARVNIGKSVSTNKTHEGAPARHINAEQELRRTLMACMLWEDGFYESGKTVADRIAELVPKVAPAKVAEMAVEARSQMYLRHAPLFLVREMVRHETHRPFVRATLAAVIQRADELSEFLAIYWKDKKQPLAKSVQRGLADAFVKFNAYQLAKYNRDNPVKLRDVLFLSHAEPKNDEQGAAWKQLIDGTLPAPDTWEVAITACGKNKEKKAAEWKRLVAERKLGAFALIRNLRNLTQNQVGDKEIRAALTEAKADKILPFRFLAALNYAPQFASELEAMMLRNLREVDPFEGTTVVLVDMSGSMSAQISDKSEMTRRDAAIGVAIAARELSESSRVFAFGTVVKEVPAYRGLGLRDAIMKANVGGSTNLGDAVRFVNRQAEYDRLIIVTDEQSHDEVGGPKGRGYVINVASNQNGVGYGPWMHIDGWSDRVLDYIRTLEAEKPVEAHA